MIKTAAAHYTAIATLCNPKYPTDVYLRVHSSLVFYIATRSCPLPTAAAGAPRPAWPKNPCSRAAK